MDWGQGGGTQPPVSPFGSFGMNGGNTQPPAPQFDQGTLGLLLTGTNAPGTPLPTNGGMMPMDQSMAVAPAAPAQMTAGMTNGGLQPPTAPPTGAPPMATGAGIPTNGGPLNQNSVASALSAGMAQL